MVSRENMDTELLLDGFLALSEDWRLINNVTDVKIPDKPFCRSASLKKFRGLEVLRNWETGNKKVATTIDFGYAHNQQLFMLITGGSPGYTWREKLRVAYYKAVWKALIEIAPTLTGRAWCMHYPENLEDCDDLRERLTKGIGKVYNEDIQAFFPEFVKHLRDILNSPNTNFYVLLAKFGQDMPWEAGMENISSICLEYASEIVVHIARDYSEQGRALLWDNEKVKSLSLDLSTNSTYFPMFTGKHGNVQLKRGNENSRRSNHIVRAEKVQFYNNVFKEMHLGDTFQKPTVQKLYSATKAELMARHSARVKEADLLLQWTGEVLSYSENLELRQGNTARMEAVLGITSTGQSIPSTNKEKKRARAERMNEFLRHFIYQVEAMAKPADLLDSFPYKDLLQQIKQTIVLPCKTMKDVLQIIVERNSKAKLKLVDAIPAIRELEILSVCELLIHYGLYGNTGLDKGKDAPQFPEELVEKLNLNSNSFKYSETVFMGLQFTPNLTVEDNTLKYIGPLYISADIWNSCAQFVNSKSIAAFSSAFTAIATNKATTDLKSNNFLEVQNMYFELICGYVQKALQMDTPGPCTMLTPNEVLSLVGGRRMKFCSAYDLIEAITANLNQSPVALMHLSRELKDLFKANFDNFQFALGQYIENQLFRSNSLGILYPISEKSNEAMLVLPFLGNSDCCFQTLSNEKKEQLVEMYVFAYERYYKRKVTDRARFTALLTEEMSKRMIEGVNLPDFWLSIDQAEMLFHDIGLNIHHILFSVCISLIMPQFCPSA